MCFLRIDGACRQFVVSLVNSGERCLQLAVRNPFIPDNRVMYGLVDCNNFYASCERVFNPALVGRPIVVLSNNDGCIVARSQEAKALGIPMGAPAFQVKEAIEANGVAVFSSNYTLYGDMSNRVMKTLATFVDHIEVYSIDEAFLDFRGHTLTDLTAVGRTIVRTVQRNTGIPVSMGLAPTKTLAKVANKYAKKYKGYKGVCLIDTEEKRIKALKGFEVGEVWGIGRRYAKLLNYQGVKTAYDFTQLSRTWVRKHLTVVGERIWSELNGFPCIQLENATADKQQICTSRSFGSKLTQFDAVFEAVSNYAASCAVKLRKQRSCAAGMLVFVMTNPFSERDPQYVNSRHLSLSIPTASTPELIGYAKTLLSEVFREGYRYKKAGVIITEIVPNAPLQADLFDVVDRDKQRRIMEAVDKLNDSLGTYKVRIAAQGYGKKWKLKNEQLSPCYTTKMEDLIQVKST